MFRSLLTGSTRSEKRLAIKALDSHPQEDDGDEGDDEDHEEGDGDPDEGRRVDADGLGETRQAGGVDDDLLCRRGHGGGLRGGGELELDVVWGENLEEGEHEMVVVYR